MPKKSTAPVSGGASTFKGTLTKKVSLNYTVQYPQGYGETKKKWPLLIFLHGAGERGSDINLVKFHGPIKEAGKGMDIPMLIVAPQCPEDRWWVEKIEDLNLWLDEIIKQYPVDKKRIYLTGISMGGEGTWRWTLLHPERFAAVIPICGKACAWQSPLIKDIPLWVFHGDKDDAISVEESRRMVKALKAAGSTVKYTEYPGVGHDSWSETYHNKEIYQWLLEHEKIKK